MIVRDLHVAAAATSLALFLLRGVWRMSDPQRLAARWVRIVPHAIDTVLLLSAVALAAMLGQYPFVDTWLTAKLLALVVYVVLGTLALKRGRTAPVRAVCFAFAILTFGYIVSVAHAHDPWGLLAPFVR